MGDNGTVDDRPDDRPTMELFRPVGPRELARIRELDWRAFPPRLHYQPIFYPVLNEDYARQIARDWNATKADTRYRGFVTRFWIDRDYGRGFEVHTVGGRIHQELWAPGEDLDEFNGHIIGRIEVVAAYAGGPTTQPTEVAIETIAID